MLSEAEYIEMLIFTLAEGGELEVEDFVILAGYAWEQLLERMSEDGLSERDKHEFLEDNFGADWDLITEDGPDGSPVLRIRFAGELPDYE